MVSILGYIYYFSVPSLENLRILFNDGQQRVALYQSAGAVADHDWDLYWLVAVFLCE